MGLDITFFTEQAQFLTLSTSLIAKDCSANHVTGVIQPTTQS